MKRFIIFSGLLGSVFVCLYPPIRSHWGETGRDFILTTTSFIDWNKLPLELIAIIFISIFLYFFHVEIIRTSNTVLKSVFSFVDTQRDWPPQDKKIAIKSEKKRSSWGWGKFLLLFIVFKIIFSILKTYK